MPSVLPVRREEMEVKPGEVEGPDELGRIEAGQDAVDVLIGQGGPVVIVLVEGLIVLLTGDGPHLHLLEKPLHPEGVKHVVRRKKPSQEGIEGHIVQLAFELLGNGGPPEGHTGEGSLHLVRHGVSPAVGAEPVDYTVEHHHLAVEVVEGAETEITVFLDLSQRGVLFVKTLEHGVYRRGKVNGVYLFPGYRSGRVQILSQGGLD